MDMEYLERRLDEERRRIAEATCPEAVKAHLEMAAYYEERIAVLRGEHKVGLKLVER